MSGKPETIDIVIVGVGGQGTLLTSRILGDLAARLSYDIKVSEVHGMSQRGGSVTTYVRIGQSVKAPLVEQKGADFILAFEQLEAYRALPYLRDTGTLIVNNQQILPLPVIIGAAEYPDQIIECIKEKGIKVIALDALAVAETAGNQRTLNTVLIGILASLLPFDREVWIQTLKGVIPAKFLDVNLAAFSLGFTFQQ